MAHSIYWTEQAMADLRAIREFIARDAPMTALSFTRRLRDAVQQLRRFPQSGSVVPEIDRPDIRELIRGNYRIVYRVGRSEVAILTVFHAARMLDQTDF